MWGFAQTKSMRAGAKAAALVCAYVAGLAYSLFLAGATHNIPTIWTANAVAIAAFMVLNRRQALTFMVASAVLHVTLELVIGAPAQFVLMVAVLDTLQTLATAVLLRALRVPSRVRDPRGLF
ncbi:MAG TPA: hybrid sensor histidine kinase/response regulator, partial [Caulobacter sp.]|nr:hybrid sensor histidine kinase/response regulator [Caulobacter sp.]